MVRAVYLPHRQPELCPGMDFGNAAPGLVSRTFCQTHPLRTTIELHQVMKKVRAGSVRVTYEDLNIRIGEKANVAFLAHSEAGVSGIIDLLCGADAPDKGWIARDHSISWPIPSTAYIQRHLSLA